MTTDQIRRSVGCGNCEGEETMSAIESQGFHGSYLMPSLDHATVADAMHPGVLTCDPEAPATEVARMMAGQHVHSVVVTGGALEYGIISALDLLRGGTTPGAEPTASDLAQEPIFTVEPSTPLRDAAQLMLTHAATHVLVMDSVRQRPVGMLSTLDIAGVLAWGEG
jgi:CBS domain-containing protein